MGKDIKSINFIPPEESKPEDKKRKFGRGNQNKKTATNNQWISASRRYDEDNRERRDGPGGDEGEDDRQI